MAHTHTVRTVQSSPSAAVAAPYAALATARRRFLALWLPLALGLLLTLAQFSARAQDDPPGRVGRLANLQGEVSWFDTEEGQWAAAERNRPLTSGDRVATGTQGRVELRVGSSVLRLAPLSELEVLRLDDNRMVWQLHSGAVALRLRTREAALETELITREARFLPERAGHFRLDRIDDTTHAAVWHGSLQVQGMREAGAAYAVIEAGQRLELWRDFSRDFSRDGNRYSTHPAEHQGLLRQRAGRLPDDEFSSWVLAEDRQDDRSTAHRYVSPEMTGAEDLDRHGRWEQHPEYGAMWFPQAVAADWAPYRHGRWAWVQPWGWTWVDEARWGFAPFHYGRWISWRGRWAWCPGTYVARPVFAPALVAWVGGPRLGVSISIGLPSVAWVPLAPREVFVPHYRHSPVYGDRLNDHRPARPGRPGGWQDRGPRQAPTGVVVYGNQGVPGAVTVVPRDVLLQRQPVARAVVVDGYGGGQGAGSAGARRPGAWEAAAPPDHAPLRRTPPPQSGPDRSGERTDWNNRNDRPPQVQPPQRPEWRDGANPSPGPTEPTPVPRGDSPRRDRERDAPRAGPERPAWNMGPQRPTAQNPAQIPVQTPVQTPAAQPTTQAPVQAQPPRAAVDAAAAPPPSRQPSRPPAAVAAPAAAPAAKPVSQPPAAQAGPDRPRDVKPERAERAVDAEDGRKRGPDARNREREAVR